MNKLYQRRNIQNSVSGLLYTQGFAYSTDFIQAGAAFSDSVSIRLELFGDETKVHRVVTNSSSSGGGFSLNIGPISLGGGEQDSTVATTQSDQRLLSRDYLTSLATNYQADLNLFVQGDPERTQKTVDTFIKILVGLMDSVELEIDKMSDEQWNLVNGAITYATFNTQEIKEMQSLAPQQTVTSEQSTTATVGGVPVTEAKKGDFTTKNDIRWEFDGENWIPTKIDLFILNKSTLDKQVNLSAYFVNEQGKKTTATRFNYPAQYWTTEGGGWIDVW